VFPFPALSLLTCVQFYFLHAVHQLHHVALVCGILCKHLMVERGAPFHEYPYPCYVQQASAEENAEYHHIVKQYHHAEYNDIHY